MQGQKRPIRKMNWTDVPQLLDLKIDLVRFDAELYASTNRLGILPEAISDGRVTVKFHPQRLSDIVTAARR